MLKKAGLILAIGALIMQPAYGAELLTDRGPQVGMFAGVRLGLTLGDQAHGARARAGLALAPTMRSGTGHGKARSRIGEGLQFGLGHGGRTELTFGGTRLDGLGLTPRQGSSPSQRMGVSTLGWVGIGAGVVVVGLVGYGIWLHEALECDPGDDCS